MALFDFPRWKQAWLWFITAAVFTALHGDAVRGGEEDDVAIFQPGFIGGLEM